MIKSIFILGLTVALLSNKAYAVSDSTAYALVLLTPGIIATGIIFGNQIEESRKDRDILFERSWSGNKGGGYSGGYFLNQNTLIFGRYEVEGRPLADVQSYKSALGMRRYWKSFFGELGLFNSQHRTRDVNLDAPGIDKWVYSNQYQTTGVVASLGISLQLWRLSLGLHGEYYKGLSTQLLRKSSDSSRSNEQIESDSRKYYRSNANIFFDLGFAI